MNTRRRRFTTIVVAVVGATFVTTALASGNSASDISRRIAKLAASSVQLDTAPVATAAPKVIQSADRRAPSSPGAVGISSVSATTITLAWGASHDNVGVAGYGVYLNNVRVGTTSARSYKFTGLTCGTTYGLGVDAFDAQRNRSVIAAVLAATAPCVDASAPSAPSDLHQSSRSATGAGVAWTDSTDNVAVAGYTVYRDGIPVASTQQAAAWVGGLVCGASHSVSVEAYDAAGNHSVRSTAIVSTSTCADTSPPSAPLDLVVSGATDSAFSVTWSPSVDDSGVAEYQVSLNDVVVRTTTSTTASFTGLACGRSYAVDIVAADAAGNRSAPARVAASTAVCPASLQDTQPPTTPSKLVRRDGTASSITLSWTASTDNVGVAGYGIYRDGNKVDASSVTAFELQGLACGTSYTLSVDAVDVNGLRSSRATLVAATEPCLSTSGLSAPSGIAAQSRTETSITLGWQGSTGATGYRIYRDGTLLGSTGSTSYTASGLSCGKSYTFGIEAYDAAGNHSTRPATLISTTSCSDALSPSTPTSLTKTGSTATSISVSWAAGTDNVGVAGYSLYVGGNPIGTTTQTSYAFSSLTCGTSYGLAVEAYDAAGNHSQRAAVSAATAPCITASAPSAPAAGSVYVATNGADGNPCSQALPCLTFDRSYKAAQPGGTVEIAGGSYPPQTITEDPSKGTGRVTFRPAGGATVNVDLIDFGQEQFSLRGPDYVTIENLTVAYTRVWGTADGIVLRNLSGKTFDIFGGVGNSVYGGSYGPCEVTVFGACTNRVIGTNTVVDGVSIFGVTSLKPGPPDDLHTDGIFVRGCSNCTIRNSKFWNNDTTHIRVQNCCGQPPIGGLTIENNWFDRPTGLGGERRWNAIDLDSVVPSLLIRNNSFHPEAGIAFGGSWIGANAKIVGNVSSQPWSGCQAGVSYRSNVWIPWVGQTTGYTCGSGDKLIQPSEVGYVSPVDGSGLDYHLRAGSSAIGAGDPGDCPADDIDRQTRSGSCDAGSDQR